MQTISVMPANAGWVVRSEAIETELHFPNGAKAEAAAKQLAQACAAAGDPTEIIIYLHDGSRGGRFVCTPGVINGAAPLV